MNMVQKHRRVLWTKAHLKWTVSKWKSVLWSDEDLAPAHTVKSTKSWLNDHGVGVLDWPANSPDLNPVENLLGIVKRKMRNKKPKKCR